MIGYILEGFASFGKGLAIAMFEIFVVLPVLFVGFFTSAAYAVQAVSYYLMIKDKTYLKRGWSFTRAEIIDENGMLKLCWFTDKAHTQANLMNFHMMIPFRSSTKQENRKDLYSVMKNTGAVKYIDDVLWQFCGELCSYHCL